MAPRRPPSAGRPRCVRSPRSPGSRRPGAPASAAEPPALRSPVLQPCVPGPLARAQSVQCREARSRQFRSRPPGSRPSRKPCVRASPFPERFFTCPRFAVRCMLALPSHAPSRLGRLRHAGRGRRGLPDKTRRSPGRASPTARRKATAPLPALQGRREKVRAAATGAGAGIGRGERGRRKDRTVLLAPGRSPRAVAARVSTLSSNPHRLPATPPARARTGGARPAFCRAPAVRPHAAGVAAARPSGGPSGALR